MKIKTDYIYFITIILLVILLIVGHQINKKNSASKKNEISNMIEQLKTRNNQLAKIQKNLFKDGKNLNNIISQNEIKFKTKKKFCYFFKFQINRKERDLRSMFLFRVRQ